MRTDLDRALSIYSYKDKSPFIAIADFFILPATIVIQGKWHIYNAENSSFQVKPYPIFIRVIATPAALVLSPIILTACVMKLSNDRNNEINQLFFLSQIPTVPEKSRASQTQSVAAPGRDIPNVPLELPVISQPQTPPKPEAKTCTICFENVNPQEMGNRQKTTILNCMHVFHANCISTWNAFSPTCPICRTSSADTLPNRSSTPNRRPQGPFAPSIRQRRRELSALIIRQRRTLLETGSVSRRSIQFFALSSSTGFLRQERGVRLGDRTVVVCV